MTNRKVVGLGLCVMDETYLVDGFAENALRTRYHTRHVAPGGMMATATAQAATLGIRTELLSMVGDDAEGREIVSALRGHGVVTRRVVRSEEQPTTVALVLVDEATRDRRLLVPDRRSLEESAPDFDLSGLTKNTVLLIDGHFPKQAMRAVRRANEIGATVVGDFHSPRPAYLELLPHVDFPILPREFGEAWHGGTPTETLFALQEEFGGSPVLTLGEQGALAWVAGEIVEIPTRRVRAKDTTGAGDVFHGAFAAGKCMNFSTIESLHLASRAAAMCCTAFGGMGRLLRPDEISYRPAGRSRR
ncbi:MAG: sulfofructose kinase [Myxococcota bacterium]